MAKPKTILFESMTKIVLRTAGYVIRCWRQETDYNADVSDQTEVDIRNVLDDLEPKIHTLSKKDVAIRLLEIDRMNAVEVLEDSNGEGLVVYADWP